MIKLLFTITAYLTLNIAAAETIEFIVSASPGSSTDTVSRKIAKDIQEATDIDIVVINKPGASHNIAFSYIEKSIKPTIFIASDVIINNRGKVGYPENIASVVEPIFYLGDFSGAIIANSNSEIRNINDLIELSKTRDIKIGHGGINTHGHLSAVVVCKSILYKCMDVPYKSGGGVFLDLLTGTIDISVPVTFGLPEIMHNSGYRGLLVLSNTPHPLLDIPALPKELSHLERHNWLMLFQHNLSTKDKKAIVKVLKSLGPKYYTEFGLWYRVKQPKEIWSKYAISN